MKSPSLRSFWKLTFALLLIPAIRAGGDVWWPEPDYPGPDRASAPAWLTERKITFSRWDGGRIEVGKGFLSGWTYFNPPWPDVIDATTRWTDVGTAELAQKMGYNFIWVTFSVGFSIESERGQWEALRAYVQECHRRGIRVAAYMSACNLFVEDMFEQVPESKGWLLLDARGAPVPYGAAAFKRIGRTTREMADITDPEWKAYLERRIDAAIDLGFDAVEFDNTHWAVEGAKSRQQYGAFLQKNRFVDTAEGRHAYELEVMRRLYPELLAHARRRRPDMVIFCNINRPLYPMQRGCTIISTEDGLEPGYYAYSSHGEIGSDETLEPLYRDLPADSGTPFDSRQLVTNLGLLRLEHGLNEGWKPVLVEFTGRRNGHRLLNQFPPLAFQLAIGECDAALCSLQGYQEGRALLDLYDRKPQVMPIVEAAAAGHRFVREHQGYFVGASYRADVAFVTDNRLKGIDFLGDLARRNVQYDVLYADRVTADFLRRFPCVVAYDAKLLPDRAVEALADYARQGGKLALFGATGAMTDWGQPRAGNPLAGEGPWTAASSEADLLAFIAANTRPSFSVLNCPYVLFTVTQGAGQPEGGYVVHLLNYLKEPLSNVRVRAGKGARPRLLALTPGCDRIVPGGAQGEWIIPRLGVYSLLVFDPPERRHAEKGLE